MRTHTPEDQRTLRNTSRPAIQPTWDELHDALWVAWHELSSQCRLIDDLVMGREASKHEQARYQLAERRHDRAARSVIAYRPKSLTEFRAKADIIANGVDPGFLGEHRDVLRALAENMRREASAGVGFH